MQEGEQIQEAHKKPEIESSGSSSWIKPSWVRQVFSSGCVYWDFYFFQGITSTYFSGKKTFQVHLFDSKKRTFRVKHYKRIEINYTKRVQSCGSRWKNCHEIVMKPSELPHEMPYCYLRDNVHCQWVTLGTWPKINPPSYFIHRNPIIYLLSCRGLFLKKVF